jgi:hypothetical protein
MILCQEEQEFSPSISLRPTMFKQKNQEILRQLKEVITHCNMFQVSSSIVDINAKQCGS